MTNSETSGSQNTEDGQYQPCEACGEPVNTLEPGVWKSVNDEQWYHEECYDRAERPEEVTGCAE